MFYIVNIILLKTYTMLFIVKLNLMILIKLLILKKKINPLNQFSNNFNIKLTLKLFINFFIYKKHIK